MLINTKSPAVIENRKVIVKLMLASHPESCILCDKGNRCQLRNIAAELGIGSLDYYQMPQYTGTQEVNPFIRRDLSKCIMCGKCIRADQELVVVGALDYMNRGFDAKPATLYDGPLEASECTFCGTCVTMCPTGALSERGKPHLGTIGTRTSSICSYCGCGCNIFLETLADRIVSVSPNPSNDLNGKTLCVKGHYGFEYVHHPDRLKKPMIRKDGELQEVEWDEALDFVAQGLRNCHAQYGPEGMAFLGSSKCTNEENYLFQKMARAIFGTNNVDNGARLHSGPSVETVPFGAMTNPLQDLEESDVILVAGSNPSASHPVAAYRIKRAVSLKGAKLIVIDPRKIDLVSFAAAWFPIPLGMDGVLLNGLIKGLLDSQGFDQDFVKEKTAGLAGFKASLASFERHTVEEQTGCPSALFDSILDLLVEAKSLALVYGHGITRQGIAHEAIRTLMNLALLKGSLGNKGGGLYPLDKENNGQGAWDMGSMPDRLPGYQSLDDEEGLQRFEKPWKRPIPRKPGVRAMEMIQGAETGSIKAMVVMGENPVRAFPDSPRIEKALSALDFLVVQDLFLTETARLAHAVLPACSFAEKDGTFTNMERRVQRIRKAIKPFQHSRPDWEILCDVSKQLGYPMDYGSVEEITQEIASLVPPYAGISMARLERGGVFWPCPREGPEGDGRLSVRDWGPEKSALIPTQPRAAQQPQWAGKEEVFLLVRGSTLNHFLGGTRSTRSSRLKSIKTTGSVEMNPFDARELGLKEGDSVTLFNPTRGGTQDGAAIPMVLSLSESLPRGMLFCPYFDHSSSALVSFSSDGSRVDTCQVRIKKES
jgi:formate dehydrogenase alpha subunit